MMLQGAAARPQMLPDYDAALGWVTTALLTLGLVMVYSASIATAEGTRAAGNNAQFYLWRHGAFLAVGVVVALATLQVPMRVWQRAAPWLFLAGFALLVLVLVPGVGREVNGSQRWLPLGVINLQPSDLVNLFVMLYA